jgi:hypothetical protein
MIIYDYNSVANNKTLKLQYNIYSIASLENLNNINY